MVRIIFAEDNDQLRNFLTLSLEREGYIIDAFADGISAWNTLKASEEGYDLLLTDLIMPGLDGIELARNALQLNPKIKTLFITGFAAVALTADKEMAGATPVLSKPFHLNRLVEEIQNLLNEKLEGDIPIKS